MSSPESTLKVATLNIQGQSGLNITKQKQIEDFVKHNKIDILHCQEIETCSNSFQDCSFISSSFNLLPNNSPINKYGTASLVRNDLYVENVKMDTNGRALVFEVNNVTFSNFYLHSGNDKNMRQARDLYLNETIPQLLMHKKDSGLLSADFNCIADKIDTLKNPEQKLSSATFRENKTDRV